MACDLAGHPDLYGLGIRLAFYLQWVALALIPSLSVPDALNMNFLHTFTVSATAAGLICHLNDATLQPVEVYIVILLLTTATLYFLIPVYLWRAVTCCHPLRAMERGDNVRRAMGSMFKTGVGLVAATMVGLSLWFWASGVHNQQPGDGSADACQRDQQYGFLFGQVPLDSPALITINILIDVAIMIVGLWRVAAWVGMFEDVHWHAKRKRRILKGEASMSAHGVHSLQLLRALTDLVTAIFLIMAIELVISWNHIKSVNDLDSAAQLIPPVLSGAYLLGSVWVRMTQPQDDDNSFFFDFPYAGGDDNTHNVVYTTYDSRTGEVIGSTDWTGCGSRHHHHRRKHHNRRSSRPGPSVRYDQYPGVMGYPEMTAAHGMYTADGIYTGLQVPPVTA